MTAPANVKPLSLDEMRGVRDALTEFLDGITTSSLDHEAVARLACWPVEDLTRVGHLDALPVIHQKSEPENFDMWVRAPGKRFVIGEFVPQWDRWIIWSEEATQRRRIALDLDEFLLGRCDPWADVHARCRTKEEALRELADHPIAQKTIGEHISEFFWSLGGLGLRHLILLKASQQYLADRAPEVAEFVSEIDEEFNKYLECQG
jgi:hypothetical protein